MQSLWQDLKYGFRGLRKQPAFTLLAVLALALGIGSATTIFSVIQNVLLDPFPYQDWSATSASRSATPRARNPRGRGFLEAPSSWTTRPRPRRLRGGDRGRLRGRALHHRRRHGAVRRGPRLGQLFASSACPRAVGRTLGSRRRPPGRAAGVRDEPQDVDEALRRRSRDRGAKLRAQRSVDDAWSASCPRASPRWPPTSTRPVILDRADPEGSRRYFMFQARLKPGVTLEQARPDRRMAKLARLPRNYPDKFTVKVLTWVDSIIGPFRNTLYTLGAAVGLLLLIACSNVANMLLGRGAGRRRWRSGRRSGAGGEATRRSCWWRAWSSPLAGARRRLRLALYGLKALIAAIPEGLIPREARIRLNVPVLVFSLAVAVWTAVVFGLVPALRRCARPRRAPARRGEGRQRLLPRGQAERRPRRGRGGPVARAARRGGPAHAELRQAPDRGPGARAENVFSPGSRCRAAVPDRLREELLFAQMLSRVQACPASSAATPSSLPPYGGIRTEIDIRGKAHVENWRRSSSWSARATSRPCACACCGAAADRGGGQRGPKVAVVNRSWSSKYFGEENPRAPVTLKKLATNPSGR